MRNATGKQLLRTGCVLVGCLWLATCSSLTTDTTAPPFRDPTMSLQHAHGAIVAGQATQAEVLQALGPATEIRFDSGYVVWVYRAKTAESEADRAEFVILFAPSGIVKKTRLRPAYTQTGA